MGRMAKELGILKDEVKAQKQKCNHCEFAVSEKLSFWRDVYSKDFVSITLSLKALESRICALEGHDYEKVCRKCGTKK